MNIWHVCNFLLIVKRLGIWHIHLTSDSMMTFLSQSHSFIASVLDAGITLKSVTCIIFPLMEVNHNVNVAENFSCILEKCTVAVKHQYVIILLRKLN